MTTGGKIVLGCSLAVLATIGLGIVALGLGGYWLKGKAEQLKGTAEQYAGHEKKIEQLRKQADRNPFTAPADGVIQEARLEKFFQIRKRVFEVYQSHQAELEAIKKKEKGDLSDLTKGLSLINEIRATQAQAMADAGMSESEYRFMVESIYKTLWASEVAKSTGGKSVSEAAGEAYDKAAEEMEKGAARAKEEASDSTSADSPEAQDAKKAMREGLEQMRKQAKEVRQSSKQMDVPPANLVLFRKHEAEIKQYALSGLEWIGL